MNPFAWIRRRTAESVMQGIADGLAAVTPEGEDAPDLAGLRRMLADAQPKQLAAPETDETPKRRK